MIANGSLKIPPRIDALYVEQEVRADETPAFEAVLMADKARWALIVEERELISELAAAPNEAKDSRLAEVYEEVSWWVWITAFPPPSLPSPLRFRLKTYSDNLCRCRRSTLQAQSPKLDEFSLASALIVKCKIDLHESLVEGGACVFLLRGHFLSSQLYLCSM